MTTKITYSEYTQSFDKNSTMKERALERAWKNRDFEIEMYWKRATYFWAFLISVFGAYAATYSSDINDKWIIQLLITCTGLTLSIAWYLVNKGSKKWQENWERHIDLLEDKITGPLYKTVLNKDGYSVSNINLTISKLTIGIWLFLLILCFFNSPYLKCLCFHKSLWLVIIGPTVYCIYYLLVKTAKKTCTCSSQQHDTFSFHVRESRYL